MIDLKFLDMTKINFAFTDDEKLLDLSEIAIGLPKEEFKKIIEYNQRNLRSLWLARAKNADLMSCKEFYNEYKREHPHSIWNDVRPSYSCATSFTNWSQWFQHISRMCLQKAKEFE